MHLSEEITVTPPSCAVFMFYSASFQCLCFSSELDEFCSLVKEAFFLQKILLEVGKKSLALIMEPWNTRVQ